jgi:hypothetical protein
LDDAVTLPLSTSPGWTVVALIAKLKICGGASGARYGMPVEAGTGAVVATAFGSLEGRVVGTGVGAGLTAAFAAFATVASTRGRAEPAAPATAVSATVPAGGTAEARAGAAEARPDGAEACARAAGVAGAEPGRTSAVCRCVDAQATRAMTDAHPSA